jgi:hypothetical protein
MPTKVEKTAKRSRAAVVVLASLLSFSLLASAYYLVDSLIVENSYKIYVGSSNTNQTVGKGLGLSYDKEFANGGYKDLTGRGLRLEKQSNNGNGMSFGSSVVRPITQSNTSYSVMSYLTSVGSSKNNTIDTNVSDDGKEGEANCDQFVTSKFYLRNESMKSGSLDLSGNVEYKINIEITKNYRNAANALRIAVLEISDEEKIYDPDTGIYDNNYFNIEVFGKPTEYVNDNVTSYSNVPEYVATTMSGIYTDGCNSLRLQVYGGEGQPSIPLIKNPNKGHENEDWQCVNFTNNLQTLRWEYDSLRDANKTYSLDYKQERAYVVAAWFEASDPDHCDDISSGYVAFTVSFTVVENESSN